MLRDAGPVTPPPLGRRALLKSGVLTIACVVAGHLACLTPAEAHAASATLRVLTPDEARTLGHLAETLVPGATAAGVIEFVDSQLAAEATESLLIARYFGVVPPFRDFYRGALAGLDAAAHAAHRQPFAALAPEATLPLAASLLSGPPPGWNGPPAPLFYLSVRSDAVDVVYGTPAGFEALGVPYMEHIMPPRRW
jgi:hypothetical protein